MPESFGRRLIGATEGKRDFAALASPAARRRARRNMRRELTREFQRVPDDPEIIAVRAWLGSQVRLAGNAGGCFNPRSLPELADSRDETWDDAARHSAEVWGEVRDWFGPWPGAQERKRRLLQELGPEGAGQEVLAVLCQASLADPAVMEKCVFEALGARKESSVGILELLADARDLESRGIAVAKALVRNVVSKGALGTGSTGADSRHRFDVSIHAQLTPDGLTLADVIPDPGTQIGFETYEPGRIPDDLKENLGKLPLAQRRALEFQVESDETGTSFKAVAQRHGANPVNARQALSKARKRLEAFKP